MSDQTAQVSSGTDAALAAPPDEQNPAIHDARLTLLATIIGVGLFVGAVVFFIL